MSLSSEKIDNILVISARGQINSVNAAAVEAELLAYVDVGELHCVLDLAQLDYISSAGLRVVLMMAKRLRQKQGQVVLCGLQPPIREVFEISGFLTLLTVAEGRAQAVEALGKPG